MHRNKTKGTGHQLQQGKFQLDLRIKVLNDERGQALVQAVQKGGRTSIFGDIQILTGQGPEQPALFLETVLLKLDVQH